MPTPQPAILGPVPRHARFVTFALDPEGDIGGALAAVGALPAGGGAVVGLGAQTAAALGASIDGLHDLPALTGPGFAVPATPAALWVWLHGEDRGDLVHATHALCEQVAGAFEPVQVIEAFQYRDSRDLSGYEDGTENPTDADAVAAAIVSGAGAGLDGASFVAAQQWVHDLEQFASWDPQRRDHTIGRRISDNEELADAPPSAHVKRTAQEDFDPPAFVVRRSMPWSDAYRAGLVFVAFGRSLDAFERLLRHMTGADDGVVDALFSFTLPETSASFWCPPMNSAGDACDWSALGL